MRPDNPAPSHFGDTSVEYYAHEEQYHINEKKQGLAYPAQALLASLLLLVSFSQGIWIFVAVSPRSSDIVTAYAIGLGLTKIMAKFIPYGSRNRMSQSYLWDTATTSFSDSIRVVPSAAVAPPTVPPSVSSGLEYLHLRESEGEGRAPILSLVNRRGCTQGLERLRHAWTLQFQA